MPLITMEATEGGLKASYNPSLLPEKNKQTPDTGPTDDGWHLEDIFQGSCQAEIGGN